jgi:hypothetical protein
MPPHVCGVHVVGVPLGELNYQIVHTPTLFPSMPA